MSDAGLASQDTDYARHIQAVLDELHQMQQTPRVVTSPEELETLEGALQIPVDSFYATSGGRKMVISKKLQGINHHHTIQRQRYEVYQTRRFIASNSYPYCQAGLAPSRRLRQNDADRQGLWYF